MMKIRKVPVGPFLVGALVALVSRGASAAVVTITDCTNDPHIVQQAQTLKVDVGTDDLVIQCALAPLGATAKLDLRANNVTVQGPGGSLSATAKSPSIRVTATDRIVLSNTTATSNNGNGGMFFRSGNGIDVTNSTVDVSQTVPATFGKALKIECKNPGCGMTFNGST